MASGDTLFIFLPQDNVPPSTEFATPGLVTAVTGFRPALVFPGVTPDSHAIFTGVWPSHYDAGGINIKLHVTTDGTVSTADGLQFELSAENTATTDDLDATGGEDFGTLTDLNITPSGIAYQNIISNNGAISHANCGSPAVGSGFRLLVARDFDHVTNTDSAYLMYVVVTEQ